MVNAAGMFAPEVGRLAGVTVPVIPFAHQYLVTEAVDGVHPTCRSCATRTTSSTSARRCGPGDGRLRAQSRHLRAGRHPGRLQWTAARAGLAAFRGDQRRRGAARAGHGRRRRRQLINGPEGFTPDNEFILGESEVRGFFVAAGFSAHGIAGAGAGSPGGALDPGRRAAARPVDHGHPPLRGAVPPRATTRWRARSRTTPPTTTSTTRSRSKAGRPLLSPTYPRLVELDCAFGEKAGWERPNWFESNAAGRRRGAAPAGLGRTPLVAGHRGRGAGHPPGGALFDETSFSKIEISGPGALAFLERLCDNRMDGRSAASRTPRC